MPKTLPDLFVIRDTREQQGWWWDAEEKFAGKIRMAGTIEKALPAGDYSLLGYEDKIIIERKAGLCELFVNMIPSPNKERFEREMDKLKDIPHKYILIESNLSKDILGLSPPQIFKGPPSSAVLKWLYELEMKYGIRVQFVGDAGMKAG
jgi:DNA excision repair protein ERCC-4